MKIPADNLIRSVADANQITVRELTGRRRFRKFAWPRQEAVYLLREARGDTLTSIAVSVGYDDHTTVVNSIRRVRQRMTTDPEVQKRLSACIAAAQCPVLFRRTG